MIKEKFKNCLLTVVLSILFIVSMFAIFGLSSCNVKKTILSNDINIENDNLNLKKDYHTDSNGNVISDNLLNPSTILLQYTTNEDGLPVVSSNNNRAVTNYLPISSNTTYTINCTNNLFIREINYASSVGVGLGYNSISATNYTFTTPSNANYLIILFGVGNQPDTYSITLNDIVPYCMLNLGSTALSYEPFGTFVPSSLISNNMFYNAKLDYYFNLNVANPGISHVIGADLLQGDTFVSINQFLDLYVVSGDKQAYVENTNLSYWKLTFNKSFPLEQLILNFDTTQANTFDYYTTYYFEDGSSYIYHNPSSSDYYRSFSVDLTQVENLSGKLVTAISFRRQFSYTVNIISVGSYLIGFNDGLTQANTNHKEEIDSLNNTIKDKDLEIQDLEFTIRDLNERLNTNINNLFYTMISAVMSTPFNILHDYLNWNFFGINLFSLFTSLVTLLIILWVVKFLLGRK